MVLVSGFNKKAASMGFFEIILVVAILFIVGVAWVVTNSIGGEVNEFLLEDEDFLTNNQSRAVLVDADTRRSGFFDGGFALFFFGMFVLGGISAWYSTNNPIFLVVTLLLIIMILVIPYFLGDAWLEVSEDFGGDEMSFMNYVLNNHLIVSVIFTFFVLGVMFFKGRYID